MREYMQRLDTAPVTSARWIQSLHNTTNKKFNNQ